MRAGKKKLMSSLSVDMLRSICGELGVDVSGYNANTKESVYWSSFTACRRVRLYLISRLIKRFLLTFYLADKSYIKDNNVFSFEKSFFKVICV